MTKAKRTLPQKGITRIVSAKMIDLGSLAQKHSACGGPLAATNVPSFDFSAWAGIEVTLANVPAFRCGKCGEIVLPGTVVNASLVAIAFNCITFPYLLSAEMARYLRRAQGLTREDLAARLGIAVSEVAAWEDGTVKISATHDMLLRLRSLQRMRDQLPDEAVVEAVAATEERQSKKPPVQTASRLDPVVVDRFLKRSRDGAVLKSA